MLKCMRVTLHMIVCFFLYTDGEDEYNRESITVIISVVFHSNISVFGHNDRYPARIFSPKIMTSIIIFTLIPK